MGESDICLDELYQDETLEAKMTREEFEDLVDDLLQRLRTPVLRSLDKVCLCVQFRLKILAEAQNPSS